MGFNKYAIVNPQIIGIKIEIILLKNSSNLSSLKIATIISKLIAIINRI